MREKPIQYAITTALHWLPAMTKNCGLPLCRLSYWPPGAPTRIEPSNVSLTRSNVWGTSPAKMPHLSFDSRRVAIYADEEMTRTHMARQHFFGRGWLSKLGNLEDIVHPELRNVEGDIAATSPEYGIVVQILKRNWWTKQPDTGFSVVGGLPSNF